MKNVNPDTKKLVLTIVSFIFTVAFMVSCILMWIGHYNIYNFVLVITTGTTAYLLLAIVSIMFNADKNRKEQLEMKREKIQLAAIKYRLKGETEYKYVVGYSHGDCINVFSCMNIYMNQRIDEEQGFMTTTGRFVDRAEALKIATAAEQLKSPHCSNDRGILISEDIDWTK